MNKYLVEFSASIGRKKMDVADTDPGASLFNPVQLKYFGIVEATSLEDANDKIVLYKDPGFVTSVVSVKDLSEVDANWAERLALNSLITTL